MATKNKTPFKDSIDDVLGDLLGDDDPSPPRPRKASSLTSASTSRNRTAVLSSDAKKSLLDDDFFSQLAKEEAEESDASDGDAQALLDNLKDLDDMDAELFESRKSKSAPAKNSSQAISSNLKTQDKTVDAKRGRSAPESEKKLLSAPVGQARPYKKFSFDDINDSLDGILSDEDNGIAKRSNPLGSKSILQDAPVKSNEPAAIGSTRPSPASNRKTDLNFEEDTDDIMDALGFGDKPDSPQKEKGSEET